MRKDVIGPAVLIAAFYTILLAALIGYAHHDPRDFIEIGRRYLQQSQVSSTIRVDPDYHNYLPGDGYDGQFNYYIALDPLNARYYIDEPIYRYERILYPLLARLVAFGQVSLIPWTLIAINMAGIALGTLALAASLRLAGTSGWWSIIFGLSPGPYVAFRRDLDDAFAIALVAIAIYLFYRGGRARLPWSAIVFALAVLARETAALFPVIFATAIALPAFNFTTTTAERPRSRWGAAVVFLLIAILPWLLYRALLGLWLGQGANLPFEPVPFRGILGYWPFSHRAWAEVLTIVVPSLIAAAVAVWMLAQRRWSAEVIALLVNVLLFVVFLNHFSYVELAASTRVVLGVALAAILMLPQLERLGGRGRLWLAPAVLLWLAPLPSAVVPALGRAIGI